jgi:hypothetical protein
VNRRCKVLYITSRREFGKKVFIFKNNCSVISSQHEIDSFCFWKQTLTYAHDTVVILLLRIMSVKLVTGLPFDGRSFNLCSVGDTSFALHAGRSLNYLFY